MIFRTLLFLLVLMPVLLAAQQHADYTYAPQAYSCWYTDQAPTIDGKLEEAVWTEAPASNLFRDIEGDIRPKPYFDTRVKMRWDSNYFYIGAELEEPHIWATYDQRDMVIFHENDFEIFIDPDGDTHHYYELEINALNTIWDLLLTKPYRNGGHAIDAWDIRGIQHAVHLEGTLNDPTDTDRGWTIEVALPWSVLEEAARHPGVPRNGEIWWVNFSRVQWRTEAPNGTYQKQIDPATGKPFPEHNWVWSPQGAIAMHQPETWGLVQFTREQKSASKGRILAKAETETRWQLWQHYYAQQGFREREGHYGSRKDFPGIELDIQAGTDFFRASTIANNFRWTIDQDGHISRKKAR
jgi:hypothetical protein